MPSNGAAPAARTPMLDRIRTATRASHASLEQALGLLEPPISRTRFVGALLGFHAFHRCWEPRIEALIDDPVLLEPRRKLSLLQRDLAALGVSPEAAHAPGGPAVGGDLGFLDGPSAAWGSLYVLEGSTLGGQVISKALRQATWPPPGGLAYFNSYGRRTGAMWAQFRDALEARSAGLDATAAVEGARATFMALQHGLVLPVSAAA